MLREMKELRFILFVFLLFVLSDLKAQEETVASKWTSHFQSTVVYQYQGGFHAKYSGEKSLDTLHNEAYSQTNTLFLGRRLWKGASLVINPEVTGGTGVSNVFGLAGAPNGEIYRVGNPRPTLFLARGYFQQEFPLRNTAYALQSDDRNQLKGKVATSRIVMQVGKFGISDFFDNNLYNHDARSQFLNWSLMASGSWDFPADLRGYTAGVIVQLIKPSFAIRTAAVMVPEKANGLILDRKILKANSETLEIEKGLLVKSHPGSIKFTSYVTFSRAPIYLRAIQDLELHDSVRYNVITGSTKWDKFEGLKYGFGINYSQEISSGLGMFSRLNFNDGKSASWAFTEIDRNFQIGYNLMGLKWKRKNDVLGMALAINGLSAEHRKYLEKGGLGFIIGDGQLNYGSENIFETFYRAQLNSFLFVSADYQFIINPGYNKDRSGPVNIVGVRVHVEF